MKRCHENARIARIPTRANNSNGLFAKHAPILDPPIPMLDERLRLGHRALHPPEQHHREPPCVSDAAQ